MESLKNRWSKEEKMNVSLKLLMAVLFFMGALIFMYPFVVDAINNYADQKRIAYYLDESNKENQTKIKAEAKEREKANEALKTKVSVPGVGKVEDPFDHVNESSGNVSEGYYKEHHIGAIFIPAIEVSLPVFDTTTDALLQQGATVLQGSSFPIGGKGTHSVLTGHTGLPDKTLFTDLTSLKKGDMVYLHILDKKLAYKIDQFKVVKPDQLDDLTIEPNEDLITLVTCTPYMVNTDRLLVRAKRVPYVADQADQAIKKTQNYQRNRLYVMIGVVVLILAVFGYYVGRKVRLILAGKKSYVIDFYLEDEKGPVADQAVTLMKRNGRKPYLVHGQQQTVISDQKGRVYFEHVSGNYYRLRIEESTVTWPVIKVRLKKLKDKQLVVTTKELQQQEKQRKKSKEESPSHVIIGPKTRK